MNREERIIRLERKIVRLNAKISALCFDRDNAIEKLHELEAESNE